MSSSYLIKDFHCQEDEAIYQDLINLLIEYEVEKPEVFYRWLYKSSYTRENLVTKLVYHEDQLIGFGSLLVINLGQLKIGSLVNLYISIEHRVLGPALMLQRALIEAGHKGHRCDFLVAKPNKKALIVFKRLGYRDTGKMKRYVILVNPLSRLTKNAFLLNLTNSAFGFLWRVGWAVSSLSSIFTAKPGRKCSVERLDGRIESLGQDLPFHCWRYYGGTTMNAKVAKMKLNTLGIDVIYQLEDGVLTIMDLNNCPPDDMAAVLKVFSSAVSKSYRIRKLVISMKSDDAITQEIKNIGFIERTDGDEQSIMVMDSINSKFPAQLDLSRSVLFSNNLDF